MKTKRPDAPAEKTRRRRGWKLWAGVIAFVWGFRLFISTITPDNPNPYITPLAVIATLMALGFAVVRTGRFGRSRVTDASLALGVVLLASGAFIQLGPESGDARRAMRAAHMTAGLLIFLPIHIYLFAHVSEALRRKPVTLVRGGVAALALTLITVWTGVLFVLIQAREMIPLLTPHRWAAWALVAVSVPHVLSGRRTLAARGDAPPVRARFLKLTLGPLAATVAFGAVYATAIPDPEPYLAGAGPLPADLGTLSNVTTSHAELLAPSEDNRPFHTCGSRDVYCHVDNVNQWRSSTHFRSANPAYQAVVARFERDRPGKRDYCASCHEPARVLAHPDMERDEQDDSVACVICHSAEARDDEHGTASYTLSPVSKEFIRSGEILVLNFPLIIAELDRHAGEFENEDLRSGALCASCHVHHVPAGAAPLLPGYEVTDKVTPFESSAYRERAGERTSCASCHMPLTYGPIDPTTTRSHDFLSSNTGVATLADDPERVRRNQDFLRDGWIRLDGSCTPGPAGEETASFDCEIVVTNAASAHDFPAGLRDVAEWWVEATVRDGDGELVLERGALDERGDVVDPPITYLLRFDDPEGRWLVGHEFWSAASESGRAPVPPGGADRERIRLELPRSALTAGAPELRLRLRHRRYQAAFARELLGVPPDTFPVTDVAEARLLLDGGDAG